MKHRNTALALLVVGMVTSYAYYHAAPAYAGMAWNVGTNLQVLLCLVLIGVLHGSREVWAVCATLAGFKLAVIGCNAWFYLDPWPVEPGKPLCSQRLDWPLGVVGLIIGALLITDLALARRRKR